ncbi:MAG: secondary thiamine-phosphate synthase enzyme YjbQ [Sedimentisphaerales bacterium]
MGVIKNCIPDICAWQTEPLAYNGILPYYTCMVKTQKIEFKTKGNCHVVDITEQVSRAIKQSQITNGTVTLFNVGSTAGITTTEYEPGLVNYDIEAAFERIAPRNARYEHEQTWHDDNGHSHVRASVLGPSLSVPVIDGQLTIGTWQQIILVDFDTRPRTRTVICQIIGE